MWPTACSASSRNGAGEVEAEQHLAALALLDHGRVELAEEAGIAVMAEMDAVAGGDALARPHESQPAVRRRRACAASHRPAPTRRRAAGCRSSCAGMTLVSLKTSTSPGSSSDGRSRTVRSSNAPCRPHDQQPRRFARVLPAAARCAPRADRNRKDRRAWRQISRTSSAPASSSDGAGHAAERDFPDSHAEEADAVEQHAGEQAGR